jgi:hypothetical protein
MDIENKCEYCEFYNMFIGPAPKCDCELKEKAEEADEWQSTIGE